MNQNVEAVVQSVKCLRKFYLEMADFLQTFDSMLPDAGYSLLKATKDLAVSDVSRTLSDPNSWLPVIFYRDYAKSQEEFFTITAVLDKVSKKNKDIPEPLLLCTKIVFNSKISSKEWRKNYWSDVPWDLYFNAAPEDKKLRSLYTAPDLFTAKGKKDLVSERGWSEDAFGDIKGIEFAAFKLMDLNSREEIREIVMKSFGLV